MRTSDSTDPEKVEFPSAAGQAAIPTFSAAFGSGQEAPLPSQMFPKRIAKGPRFYKEEPHPISIPEPESVRSSPADDQVSGLPLLTRQVSNGSDASFDSSISRTKRWIIE
jgi:hypothetical protein